MFNIKVLNNISPVGLALFPQENYRIKMEDGPTDAIILRSASLHDKPVSPKLKAIARAGAGVNNIPVEKMTDLGIPVFNTPGANANAVKELVIAALLIASRFLCSSWLKTNQLKGDNVATQVESLKKEFTGSELPGKKLGIIGLGAIGVQVANTALNLGMEVIAYDPHITISNAWQLSAQAEQASSMTEVLQAADFISLHVPYMESTHHLINKTTINHLKKGSILLNFSRANIVDEASLLNALEENKLARYVTDFPNENLINQEKVLCFPHLGASTIEAEENCAMMAVNTLKRFLEYGETTNSVNFPSVTMPYQEGVRVAIANKNVPNMLSQISNVIAEEKLNIRDMINRSQDEIAYTLIDVDKPLGEKGIQSLKNINGVINHRILIPRNLK